MSPFWNSQGSAARTPHSLSHEPGFPSTGRSPPASSFPSNTHHKFYLSRETVTSVPKIFHKMTLGPQPTEVLFLGSIPLSSASETFTAILQAFPSSVHRIPDGETGERGNFIAWQHPVFPIELVQPRWGGGPLPRTTVTYSLSDIKPTGYDDRAIASYETFRELRTAGTIPSDVRFQVALPSPYGVVRGFIETEYCSSIELLYEERLLQALRHIQDTIPASDLLIQLDLPAEIAALESDQGRLEDPYFKAYFSPVKAGLFERLTRLTKALDPDVQLGFHLCYGDFGHTHFVQPADAKLLVGMANMIVQSLGPIHHVTYIHMPVPRDRIDEAYFKPMTDLVLEDTQLFLGLVHANDEGGTNKRIEMAQKIYSKPFGVATECGMGRTPPAELENLFEIFASVTGTSKERAEKSK